MAQGQSSYGSTRKLSAAKAHEFSLVSGFKNGYRAREDITTLPPGVLVKGSQNCVTNVNGRVQIRQGYTLDGQADSTIASWLGSADWLRHTGDTRNLRSGLLTNGTDGKLQVRYVANAGDYYNGTTFTQDQTYWIDLLANLTSVAFNFAEFWSVTEVSGFLVFVNGAPSISEWSGGITTLLSTTANTITKTGIEFWAEEGFYTTGTRKVTINGTEYTYTGGEATTTLTGVTPDPSAEPINSVIFQTVKTTLNSAMTDMPLEHNDIISNLQNQIYVGSLTDNTMYISKVNDYTNYSFSSPRLVGEGALATLDAALVGFIPQENAMYITAGRDYWYETVLTLSADLSGEAFEVDRLKTVALEASQSQSLITKIKDNVAFVSNEPIVKSLGRVDNVVITPQMTDLSYSIVDDMNEYDFTDGNAFYFRNYLYISVPKSSVVLIFNMTDPSNHYWEAPQILPIGRFAIIDGELYGHGYNVAETYKLFTGYNDNGKSMDMKMVFSFQNEGIRSTFKSMNAFYVEGYITSNTELTLGIQYDIDGCATSTSFTLKGNNSQFVCTPGDSTSLGKSSLGKQGLGTNFSVSSSSGLPPKFRWIKTFNRVDYFERQVSFETIGIDQRVELLAFGGNANMSDNIPVKITD